MLRTIIAWPAPTAQNTGASHGSALGADEIAATKKVLGFDPAKTFIVADDVIAHTHKARDRGAAAHARVAEDVRRLGDRDRPRARRCSTA